MISKKRLKLAERNILLVLFTLIAIEISFVVYNLDFSCQQPISGAQSKSEAIFRSECRIFGIALSITDALLLGMAFLIFLIVIAVYAQKKLSIGKCN